MLCMNYNVWVILFVVGNSTQMQPANTMPCIYVSALFGASHPIHSPPTTTNSVGHKRANMYRIKKFTTIITSFSTSNLFYFQLAAAAAIRSSSIYYAAVYTSHRELWPLCSKVHFHSPKIFYSFSVFHYMCVFCSISLRLNRIAYLSGNFIAVLSQMARTLYTASVPHLVSSGVGIHVRCTYMLDCSETQILLNFFAYTMHIAPYAFTCKMQ